MARQENWKLKRTESLRDFRVVSVQERTFQHVPTGADKKYAVCDSADWVLVIPVTPNREIVFIRQFRHALGRVVLEIPGGVMDPGETSEQTAVRELREETGYVPERVEMLGPLFPNPALNTASFHVAFAHDCVPKFEPEPEPFEEIAIDRRPLDSVNAMVASGELQHALCIAALAVSGLLKVKTALTGNG